VERSMRVELGPAVGGIGHLMLENARERPLFTGVGT
jgi:hypothetical protein